MKKRESGDLFEAFADPRAAGSSAHRGDKSLGSGFRKFLEERGEYPFRDEGAPSGKILSRSMLHKRAETLLVVALAFLITNIASFSVGVWNGKRGTASAEEPSSVTVTKEAAPLPDVTASVVTDPVPVLPAPAQPAPARTPAEASPAMPVSTPYHIRVASLGLNQTKEAEEIARHFEKRGYRPSEVRRVGSCLVIEVGAYPSTNSDGARRALEDIRRTKFKFSTFKDAYFIKR